MACSVHPDEGPHFKLRNTRVLPALFPRFYDSQPASSYPLYAPPDLGCDSFTHPRPALSLISLLTLPSISVPAQPVWYC